jgi:hypothetical protein
MERENLLITDFHRFMQLIEKLPEYPEDEKVQKLEAIIPNVRLGRERLFARTLCLGTPGLDEN